ncbi:alkaline phosphatase D family protein [Saccharopolyspora sp. NPDC002376]
MAAGAPADACAAAYGPDITMLGFEQERWLYSGFETSNAAWNILGSNVMLARLDHDGPGSIGPLVNG